MPQPSAPKPELREIVPMLPSGRALAEDVEFYVRHLGFAVDWQNGGMAGLRRDALRLLLVENRTPEWVENASCSIGVRDLDGLYAEYREAPAKVGPLEVKFWGRREFHMVLPSGVCLQFYEAAA